MAALAPFGHRRRAQGDVRQPRALRGVANLATTPTRTAPAQAVPGLHVELAGVDGPVDALVAHPGAALNGQVGSDGSRRAARRQLRGHTCAQHGVDHQAAEPGSAALGISAPLGVGRPVVLAAAVATHLTGHRRAVCSCPFAEFGPRRQRRVSQSQRDLLALVHRQGRACHAVASTGRGARSQRASCPPRVHRPVELAVFSFGASWAGSRSAERRA